MTPNASFDSTFVSPTRLSGSTSLEVEGSEGSEERPVAWTSRYFDDSAWVEHIPDSLYGAFKPVFTSYQYGTVKIYEIDYTMYEQYLNQTSADWAPTVGTLDGVDLDGELSATETGFSHQDVVFGGGYEATVYTRANGTHLYYGIRMANYTVGDDAFAIQISPLGSTSTADIRAVNYEGQQYYDGHLRYDGEWVSDTSSANATLYATGEHVIEFLIPLGSQ